MVIKVRKIICLTNKTEIFVVMICIGTSGNQIIPWLFLGMGRSKRRNPRMLRISRIRKSSSTPTLRISITYQMKQ